VQGNLVILPAAFAADFEAYCRRNAQACPLLGMSAAGDPMLPALGRDFDVRTDLPRYRVWREGEIAEEPQEISRLWRDDWSRSSRLLLLVRAGVDRGGHSPPALGPRAEPALLSDVGRHGAAGPFSGKLIVSMRPLVPRDAIRAVQITSRPDGARRTSASRLPGGDRHRRPRAPMAAIRSRSCPASCRSSGRAGHAGVGDPRGAAAVLHHPQARRDGGHGPAEQVLEAPESAVPQPRGCSLVESAASSTATA
jgi:hypothetical protein